MPVRPHLDALVVMLRVWGSYGLLAGISLGVLAAGAEAALLRSDSPAAAVGAVGVLAGCAAVLIAGGMASWLAARGLQRRRASGRLGALALAVVNLFIVPFGTAIGVYTFWVLLNNDARREFGRPPRAIGAAR
jgi:hypothetical protein